MVNVWLEFKKTNGSERFFYSINCTTRQIRTFEVIHYNRQGVITASDDLPTKWSNIAPETIGEELFIVFCKGESDFQGILDEVDEILRDSSANNPELATDLSRKTVMVNSIKANVRAVPSMKGEVLTTVSKGEIFAVIKKEGEWFLIQTADHVGWIHKTTVEFPKK